MTAFVELNRVFNFTNAPAVQLYKMLNVVLIPTYKYKHMYVYAKYYNTNSYLNLFSTAYR